MHDKSRQRREVYFSGRVQGVGFRFTAHRLAQRHKVSGFVRNLPDRRVQLVVEGTVEEIDALLAEIVAAMHGHIRDVQTTQSAPTDEFDGFGIRQ